MIPRPPSGSGKNSTAKRTSSPQATQAADRKQDEESPAANRRMGSPQLESLVDSTTVNDVSFRSIDELRTKWALIHAEISKPKTQTSKSEGSESRTGNGDARPAATPADADPSGIPAASREYAEELLQLAAKRSGVLLSEVRGQRVLPALVTIGTERSPAASPARGGGTGTRSSETEPEVPSVTAPGYQVERPGTSPSRRTGAVAPSSSLSPGRAISNKERRDMEREALFNQLSEADAEYLNTLLRKERPRSLSPPKPGTESNVRPVAELPEDIALQRVRQKQIFLRRTLLRIDNQCKLIVVKSQNHLTAAGEDDETRDADRPFSAPGEHFLRSSAVVEGASTRYRQERAKFAKKVMKVVQDMRNVVVKRKEEINSFLTLQQHELSERVKAAEEAERQRQLLHRSRCRATQMAWAQEKAERQRKAKEKKEMDRLQKDLESEMRNELSQAIRRKEDWCMNETGLLASKRHFRERLHQRGQDRLSQQQDAMTQQERDHEAKRAEAYRQQREKEEAESKRRREHRAELQRKTYAEALAREEARQQHIAEEQRRTREREQQSLQRQLEELRRKDQLCAEREAHRIAVATNAQELEEQWKRETDEMLALQATLSAQHQQEHEHQMQKKRDFHLQQNEIRMKLAEQHARAKKFEADTQRAGWEKRKHILESQDQDLWKMKQQLRQDKERLAMQTIRLKSSQRKGDLAKLDQFLHALNHNLEGTI